MLKQNTQHKRILSGLVISAKGQKTLVVRVDSFKINKKYLKKYIVSKKYKVHDEKNQFTEGVRASFVECRPLSKEKRWRVLYS